MAGKFTRILTVYCIVSGFSIILLWTIFFSTGFMQKKMVCEPLGFSALLAAEAITSAGLLMGGFGLIAKKSWARPAALVSLGMMLYAVIAASGQFAQWGNLYLTLMFAVLSAATMLLLIISIAAPEGLETKFRNAGSVNK